MSFLFLRCSFQEEWVGQSDMITFNINVHFGALWCDFASGVGILTLVGLVWVFSMWAPWVPYTDRCMISWMLVTECVHIIPNRQYIPRQFTLNVKTLVMTYEWKVGNYNNMVRGICPDCIIACHYIKPRKLVMPTLTMYEMSNKHHFVL